MADAGGGVAGMVVPSRTTGGGRNVFGKRNPGLSLIPVAFLFFAACGSSEESRARAEEWCRGKAVEAAAQRIPVYGPSAEEIERGHQAFMRECMRNQGY